MNDSRLQELFGAAREEARESVSTLAPPNLEAALAATSTQHHRLGLGSRLPQIAATAAVLVIAIGALLILEAPAIPAGDIPSHLTMLVDSLYSEESFVLDELAPRLTPRNARVLDAVWESVAEEIRTPDS